MQAITVTASPSQIALERRAEIYSVLASAAGHEVVLEASFMKLGSLLVDFKAQEHWRALGYQTFGQFMDDLRVRYNRGRTQLWAYLNVAESLLPYYDVPTLEAVGISKAQELRRAVVQTGKALPPAIIDAATKQATTIKELRALIGETLNLRDDREPGTWFDFGGTYFTPAEKDEFKRAVEVAIYVCEIKPHVPEHIQRKEIMLAFAREFYGTHAAEVNGPGAQDE